MSLTHPLNSALSNELHKLEIAQHALTISVVIVLIVLYYMYRIFRMARRQLHTLGNAVRMLSPNLTLREFTAPGTGLVVLKHRIQRLKKAFSELESFVIVIKKSLMDTSDCVRVVQAESLNFLQLVEAFPAYLRKDSEGHHILHEQHLRRLRETCAEGR
jgi:hypothetical protein